MTLVSFLGAGMSILPDFCFDFLTSNIITSRAIMNNITTNNTAPIAAPMAVSGNALVSPAEVVGVTLAVDAGAVMLCVIDAVPADDDDLCVIDAVPVDDLCVLAVIVYEVDVVDNLLLVAEDDGLTIAIKGIMNNVIMIILTSSDCHAIHMNNVMVAIKVSMTFYTQRVVLTDARRDNIITPLTSTSAVQC